MEWLRKQTEEEVLNHLFANEDFDRYYRQTLLAVKTIRSHRAPACGSSVNLSRRNILIKGIFMSYQYVNVVTINKVAVIEFNYGRKLNALSKVFIDDLMQALSDLNRPEIRCIICARRVDPKSSPQVTIFTNCRLAVAIRSPMMIHCVKSPA